MKINEKRSYLETVKKRYRKSNRKQKKKILDEFCATTGYNRKYAIYALRKRKGKGHKKKSGRRSFYTREEFLRPLKILWQQSDFICSKKLKVIIREWLPFYENRYGNVDDVTRGQLYRISPATIDRILRPLRPEYPCKGRSGTKPGRILKNQIPIKTDNWDVTKPGFFEADTVAHCGTSLSGNFVWSLTMTDILTGWTENRAIWNKGSAGVVKQVKNIEKSLVFPIYGFDCDNGSEFLNYHLIRYFQKRKKPVQFTRSRPYHKDDNAHVEQKNWTHVRQIFGYARFDKKILVSLMNDLYSNEYSLYQNHFIPTMKLVEKIKINSKYRKRYDKPKTPYQRVMESEDISEEIKEALKKQHESLNPFELKQAMEQKLKRIFAQIGSPAKFTRKK
jgi:hypothetical protein